MVLRIRSGVHVVIFYLKISRCSCRNSSECFAKSVLCSLDIGRCIKSILLMFRRDFLKVSLLILLGVFSIFHFELRASRRLTIIILQSDNSRSCVCSLCHLWLSYRDLFVSCVSDYSDGVYSQHILRSVSSMSSETLRYFMFEEQHSLIRALKLYLLSACKHIQGKVIQSQRL